MFKFLYRQSKIVTSILIFLVIPVCLLINYLSGIFIGGLLVIGTMIAAMVLRRDLYFFYVILNILSFFFFVIEKRMPKPQVITQGVVFGICLVVASIAGCEIGMYIFRSEMSKKKNAKLTMALIHSFVTAIDAKDHYLHNHSYNVCYYSKLLAKSLGYSAREVEEIGLAALFHDIGKINVSEKILNKPDKLDENEWFIMKQHTTSGVELLKNVDQLAHLFDYIKYHHRHYNGKGYPLDCPMDKVPIEAGIIAVADAFDAMTSDRPYRKALSMEEAYKELKDHSGTQFNPEIIKAFFKAEIKPVQEKCFNIDLILIFDS